MKRFSAGLFRLSPPLVSVILTVACAVDFKEFESGEAPPGWRVLGPGGGGAQFEPTVSPHDPNHVFIRCDMTGAYVTRDGGRSWRMFNLRGVVRDFEFDPHDPDTVYASNSSLYRSEDGGSSWNLVYPDTSDVVGEDMSGDHAGQRFLTSSGAPGGQIVRVRVDPQDGRVLYMGRCPGSSGGDGCAILVSRDRGASWAELGTVPGRTVHALFPPGWEGTSGRLTVFTDSTAVRIGPSGEPIEALETPGDGGILAADGGRGADGTRRYYILTAVRRAGGQLTGGVFRSNDGGENWREANGPLFSLLTEDAPTPVFETLAVSERHPDTAYLSCRSCPTLEVGAWQRRSGVLRTTSAGEAWEWKLEVGGGEVLSANFSGGWLRERLGWLSNPTFLGVGPDNPDVCYGTDSGRTFHTLDGGATWRQLISEDGPQGARSRGMDVTTTYGVHFDPFDANHLFVTYTDIGLFRSRTGGRTWEHAVAGIPRQWRNTCYWLVFDPAVRGRIWSVWSNVHDLPRPKMHRSGNLVNDRRQGGAAVSGDGGRWWELLSVGVLEDGDYVNGLPWSSVLTHITLDVESPVDSRVLYVTEYGRGVYKSTDGGRTWSLKARGLGENRQAWRTVLLPSGRLILLVARGGIEGQGYIDGGLYESDDGAETWRPMAMPDGANAPNDLVFDPASPNRMYLSCWPRREGGREVGGGVYRTDDGGRTWVRILDEKIHAYAAAVDPHDPSTLFVGTFNSALFRSDDRGGSWRRLRGYDFKWGHRPVPDPHRPGMLYLTTFGGSVFHGPADGVPAAPETIRNLPEDRLYYSGLER